MVITSGQYLPFVVLQLYCNGLLAAIWLMRYVASSGSRGVCTEIDFTEKIATCIIHAIYSAHTFLLP